MKHLIVTFFVLAVLTVAGQAGATDSKPPGDGDPPPCCLPPPCHYNCCLQDCGAVVSTPGTLSEGMTTWFRSERVTAN